MMPQACKVEEQNIDKHVVKSVTVTDKFSQKIRLRSYGEEALGSVS